MSEKDVAQPRIGSGGSRLGKPQYMAGAKRSVSRLANLGYDPIGELVATSNALKIEIKRWEDIRDQKFVSIIGLNKDGTEKVQQYSWMAHYALIDKLIAVGEKLLRYGYGRVPENIEEAGSKPKLGLTVKMAGRDVLIINAPEEDSGNPENEPIEATDVEFR
jgi:hypothetical protein